MLNYKGIKMQNQNSVQTGKVLVVGGGVGGIRAALDIAESGGDVVLVDNAYSIGGLMTQLDRTFPTNNCDLCTLSPHLSESGRELHIDLKTMTDVTGIQGEAGAFEVTLKTWPRYIDVEKCTACGECLESFPECIRFTPGLDHRAPTCMRYPQATPWSYSVDMDKCNDPEALEKTCKIGAILPDDEAKETLIEVSAVILAPGASIFDPSHLDHFGKGLYDNVFTSLEYERILSASGPTGGILVRPSDGKQPKRIAWIQCVGSRGIQKGAASYCSSACCMFATKEAIVTRERFKDDIETVIFYMDMRTSGKDYELYYQRAKDEFGVRFVRSRPHSVVQNPKDMNLAVCYTQDEKSENITEEFDMVVLSTGFMISEETREMAEVMGIKLNPHGFAETASFKPVETSRPGIFVCGMFESPKDIPETMVQGSAAACKALGIVPRGKQAKAPADSAVENQWDDYDGYEAFPPERDVTDETPRTGVFVCDCGFDIGGVIDVPALVDYCKTIAGVEVAIAVGHGCSGESQKNIENLIKEHQLNRVVIGGCSPRTHETKFQDMVRRAGLNKYLVEIANIRDQDTWVHRDQPEIAANKARELIRMAVARVKLSIPLVDYTLPMNKDILVVGGGVAGMTSALALADRGFKVFLAERSPRLGGMAANIRKTLEGEDVRSKVAEMIERTMNHEKIQVMAPAIIVDHSGMPGMFTTGVQSGPQMFYTSIKHGVTILATGALPNKPSEYLLNEHDAVVTQLELDERIEDDPDSVKNAANVVMIQCVGSRTKENPNCSRVCCQAAVKNALRIIDLNPDANIIVLYRDMRTYGFQEDYYKEAREKGVIFVRYSLETKPAVEADEDKVTVTFNEPILGIKASVTADILCLSTGFISDDESTEDLGFIFHLQRTDDGYFLEDHIKLRPVDLPVPGFFVAGTAHSPKNIRESIAQAQAAAGRAQTLLSQDEINLGASVAKVDGKKCAACLICVRACPYSIPFINADGYSEIDPARCHGCGICAAECPAKAIQLMQFQDDQILARLDGLFERMN